MELGKNGDGGFDKANRDGMISLVATENHDAETQTSSCATSAFLVVTTHECPERIQDDWKTTEGRSERQMLPFTLADNVESRRFL